MIIKSVTELIGNTPLLEISEDVHGLSNVKLYCKLEYRNAFGSLKDRVAWNMLKEHVDDLKGKTVLEASSGNTAKALTMLSSIHGLDFKTISNRIKVPEVRKLLTLLGADIQEMPGSSECPDPNNPDDYMIAAQNLAKSNPDKYFYTDQYFNEKNPQAHEETAWEIAKDLPVVDYYFTILGTTGSSTGIGKILRKERNSKVIGLVSERGVSLPGGRTMDEMWEMGFFKKDFYDDILVSDNVLEAVQGMLELNRKVGLLCGPTTGLAYKKTIEYLEKLPRDKPLTAVFIACDRLETYLSYIERYAPEAVGTKKQANIFANLDIHDAMEVEEMTPEDLEKNLDDVLVLDIRSPTAFSMAHLKNSINIPEYHLEEFCKHSIPISHGKTIVVVCPIGTKSRKIAAVFQKEGFEAYSLKGGFTAWKNSKHSLCTKHSH